LARLVRAYRQAGRALRDYPRAMAVLAKVNAPRSQAVELAELMKCSDYADAADRPPVRQCWIERRSDDADRRVNRLYLRKAARPLLANWAVCARTDRDALEGINPADAHRMLGTGSIKEKRAQRHSKSGREPPRKDSALADPILNSADQKGNPRAVRGRSKARRRRALAFVRRFRRAFCWCAAAAGAVAG